MVPFSENERIAKIFFKKCEGSGHYWICKCSKKLIQKKGYGWSNLIGHIKTQHPEFFDSKEKLNLLDQKFVSACVNNSIGNATTNIFGWIEWVCGDLKPFSFPENALTRKYSSLKGITNKTLKKYIQKLTVEVEKIISKDLPEKFALVIVSWTYGTTHFF